MSSPALDLWDEVIAWRTVLLRHPGLLRGDRSDLGEIIYPGWLCGELDRAAVVGEARIRGPGAAVWEVTRSSSGVIVNLAKKMAFVNHYSFHIMDPQWGHVTIKMSGHPPFAAQVIRRRSRVRRRPSPGGWDRVH